MKPVSEAATALSRAESVYRSLAFHDFSEDLALGLNIGFYRTFAVPEIAQVLVSTGKMAKRTELRAKATGQMMYLLFRDGLDGARGAETVAALNRIHARWRISNDAFLYVLACFDIAPMRWCDTYAWRPTTEEEKEASHTFYRALADRMGIRDVPPAWGEFAAWMDQFEQARFTATSDAAELWAATRDLLTNRFPSLLGPFIRAAADALLDEPLRHAFGAPHPSAPVRALASGGMRLRARRIRHSHTNPGYRPVLPPSVRDLE
ncbi:oxygenase MpaB family protein [Streptomyces sp. KLMMK]|uniref:oxygenase MpaB family protein n=1 Tax=Streptomyces sp. KLMMK TaxID=3109353 RepID=UPI00300018C0